MPGQARWVGGKSANADFEALHDFDALFDQHWESVCRAMYLLVGDWDEAQDLALEAFLRLYSQPPDDDRNLVGWLYRVSANLAFNALRARVRRARYEQQAGMQSLQANSPPDPAAEVEARLEQEQVRAALLSMRPRSARLLLLRYSGLSYAQVAAALDISPASVGALLARAEKEFEKAFQK